MKKNLILITILILALSLIIFMCSGNPYGEHNDFTATGLSIRENLDRFNIPAEIITFDYDIPDGLILDEEAKMNMINAKINHLQTLNRLFWGEAPQPKSVREEIFNEIWDYINKYFVGFDGLEADWDAVHNEYSEIVSNASYYGEFAYALSMLAYTLKEGHSRVIAGRVIGTEDEEYYNYNSYLNKAPVFTAQSYSRIGACYIVTENEELIINNISDNHDNPYNFKVGDEIVGLNGISWGEWLPYLEKSGLPIIDSPGSAESARRYVLLKSAMANINLFEKINIKRVDTGEIDTMDIVYLEINEDNYQICSELTETKGLKSIDDIGGEDISYKMDESFIYGIIKDKNIAYIYLKECPHGFNEFDIYGGELWDPYKTKFSNEFEKAIKKLMDTDAMIIDLRYNLGGRTEPLYKGLAHLLPLEEDIRMFKSLQRDESKDNRTAKIDDEAEERIKEYTVLKADNPNLFYNKPVIILTGPDCISACDILIAFFDKYPELFTIIGKNSNASFSGVINQLFNMEDGDFAFESLTVTTIVYDSDEENILLRSENFLDIPVWFTKEDIINGIDTVREYAFNLIEQNK